MLFTIEEIKRIITDNTFIVEHLGTINKYKFTDAELFSAEGGAATACTYEIYQEGDGQFIKTSKPIFGVTDMRIQVEKIKDIYLIITLFSKDNDLHVITLEKTLQ